MLAFWKLVLNINKSMVPQLANDSFGPSSLIGKGHVISQAIMTLFCHYGIKRL